MCVCVYTYLSLRRTGETKVKVTYIDWNGLEQQPRTIRLRTHKYTWPYYWTIGLLRNDEIRLNEEIRLGLRINTPGIGIRD